jgi:Na+-driven multidrug efflux pump
MVANKTWVIVNIVLLAITIAAIASASYGLGKEETNKSSPAYQAASQFLTISIILCIVFVISLIILSVVASGGSTTQFRANPLSVNPRMSLSSPQQMVSFTA